MERPRVFGAAICLAVVLAASTRAAEPAAIHTGPGRIDFRFLDQLATRYFVEPTQIKPYFWPLVTPSGVIVTRAWPMEKALPGGTTDHVHQKSAWFSYGDVIPEGLEVAPKLPGIQGVDFWTEVPMHGRIVCVESSPAQNGSIVTRNEWRMPDGRIALIEKRTIAMYAMGPGRLLIVTCDLCPQIAPITFGDTKEGAIGVRVHDQLRTDFGKGKPVPPANKITNANGKQGEAECWGRKSDWCDYSGEIDGKSAGIAVFDDPRNSPRACWHVRSYGLMAGNPFGRDKSKFPDVAGRTDLVKLAKGEHLTLRYGIYTHDGNVQSGKVAEAFAQFVELRNR